MSGPSLRRTAAFSAVLHLTLFLIAGVTLRQTKHPLLPSPYVVALVQEGSVQNRGTGAVQDQAEQKAPTPPAEPAVREKKNSSDDYKRADEMISALAAKKKLNRLARLKSAMVSIQGPGRESRGSAAPKGSAGRGNAPGAMSYEDKISSEIRKHWAWPNIVKNLKATVIVRIRKDGSISLQDLIWEEKSDNRMFNNSIVQAIASASPVTPPPSEMELGINFYP